MRTSEFLKLRLPERKAVNDVADIEDLTFDMEKLDAEAARQKLIDDNLQRDKVENTDFNAHKVANVLDHPDNSVTDAKIGERSVGTSKGMLQALLDAIGNAIKAITGNATWSELPAVTLSATKLHIDSKENPHGTTKAQVGLGNADNTSDAAKPVSTAQAEALAQKLNINGGTLKGNLILNAAPTANLQAATKKYVDDVASEKGNGDMLKTVYDANNDGVVDNSKLLGGLASGEFCRVNDTRLSDARNAADVYTWAKATNKPTYTASEVGLGNVNNTADANKSVNYASSAGSIDGGTY
ncbi:MAG: hypothetical protein RR675_02235 [Oscillospiraceae bacterium]